MAENEQKTPTNKNISPIRTFQSDVEEMLKQGNVSLTKIAVAENEKRVRTEGFSMEPTGEPASNKTRLIISASAILILLGLITLGVIYFWKNRGVTTSPQTNVATTQPLIATDSDKNLNITGLTREKIIKELLKERDQDTSTLASISGIRFIEGSGANEQTVNAKIFLEKLKTRAPAELTRSLDDNFIFGFQAQSVAEPFLILKIGYYQNAFAGMLSWEKDLREDLGPLFIRPEPTQIASSSDDVLNRNLAFQDIVVKNRDTRALRDSNGKIILLYSFPDKYSIVITTNAETLQEVATRLFAGKLVQ